MDKMNYNKLIEEINSFSDNTKIEKRGHGIGIVTIASPVSITENEFNIITQTIIDKNLLSGFECATAFGISSLAAGLGFKVTGGKLVTMDSYIEEKYASADAYANQPRDTNNESLGKNLAESIGKHYDIPVSYKVGWSPEDIPKVVETSFGPNAKFDYVFIDALHTNEALTKDVDGIFPYLAENCVFFLHDLGCFHEETIRTLGQKLGGHFSRFENCDYELSYLNRS